MSSDCIHRNRKAKIAHQNMSWNRKHKIARVNGPWWRFLDITFRLRREATVNDSCCCFAHHPTQMMRWVSSCGSDSTVIASWRNRGPHVSKLNGSRGRGDFRASRDVTWRRKEFFWNQGRASMLTNFFYISEIFFYKSLTKSQIVFTYHIDIFCKTVELNNNS